ncbi:MAG: DUF4149 domain-containing protein [Pseudomonadota bacterium]|nr:DUF4149 domain-containing protein [Pseudomonadota bacterium]
MAGVWFGVLAAVGALAAPSAFATLAAPVAGKFVGRLFELEAGLSLGMALLLFILERQRTRAATEEGTGPVFSTNLMLLLATLFCTVAGYYAVVPMMEAARAGQGRWSFGALHAVSAGFFFARCVLVLALAWRLSAFRTTATPS